MSNYTGKQAEVYDLVHEKKSYESEVGYIINMAKVNGAKSKKVLDVGCGTGRHLEEFENRGWSVTGVDPSQEMVNKAKSRLSENATVKCDIKDINETFDLVISLFNVINHIKGNNEDLEVFFKEIW